MQKITKRKQYCNRVIHSRDIIRPAFLPGDKALVDAPAKNKGSIPMLMLLPVNNIQH